MATSLPELIPLTEMAREQPTWKKSRLRDLVYHSKPRLTAKGEKIPANGFASCIVRDGYRILIDRGAFAKWIERGRAAPLSELDR